MTMQAGHRIITKDKKVVWVMRSLTKEPGARCARSHYYIKAPGVKLTTDEAHAVRQALASLLKRKDFKWESDE